jgi:hypothetical protein
LAATQSLAEEDAVELYEVETWAQANEYVEHMARKQAAEALPNLEEGPEADAVAEEVEEMVRVTMKLLRDRIERITDQHKPSRFQICTYQGLPIGPGQECKAH